MARASAAKAKPGGGSGKLHWLAGVACGGVLAFATPSAIVGGVLLAPALLAAAFETDRKRPVTRVVLIASAGFTFGPIWHLNNMGGGNSQAIDLVLDVSVLCPAWLAGATAWAVSEFLPLVLRLVSERQAAARIASLLAEAKALRAEWDLERFES